MNLFLRFFAGPTAALILFSAPLTAAPVSSPRPTPNLFHVLLGKSDEEVHAKIDAAWRQLFFGDDQSQRVYFPVGENLAYIADIGSHDVRTEGMSYGMMIAVQTNHRTEFDRLWRWAKTYMYHPAGNRAGYFAWHGSYDGKQLDPGPACDGEEWFTMALFFAAGRWTPEAGSFDYRAEADALLRAMLGETPRTKPAASAMFNRVFKQVVFVPSSPGNTFTDPSYHLPAFYELWAQYAQHDGIFWEETAVNSRALFKNAADRQTGLMPDYANFDGTPHQGSEHESFRFDAWRTLANVGLDYAWFAADPWEKEQSNRVLKFLASQGADFPNQFTLAGKPLSTKGSAGLSAMAAVAGLAADPEVARPFVQRLWDLKIPSGPWRYYDGMLYTLALLEVSGEFRAYPPVK